MINTLNDWTDALHRNAKDKGWWPPEGRNFPEVCMLIVSEVSELLEAYRDGALNELCNKSMRLTNAEEEIADIIIRTLDLAGHLGIDVDRAVTLKHAYNTSRSHRHGGKKA